MSNPTSSMTTEEAIKLSSLVCGFSMAGSGRENLLHAFVKSACAIIDALPKTHDGVPIVPGIEVWHEYGFVVIVDGLRRMGEKTWPVDIQGALHNPSCLFSTREAALAAGAEQEKHV